MKVNHDEGVATAGGPAGRHVLIIVQNMPVPLDRRVWQECRALTEAGSRPPGQRGAAGGRGRRRLLSCVVRFALRALQGRQAVTQFSHEDAPPRDLGMTWSIVSSETPGRARQYWQV